MLDGFTALQIGNNMKTYIIYDDQGNERETVTAKSHNEAEKKAKEMYGHLASVCYTEL